MKLFTTFQPPPLEGNQSQIKWARSIRARKIEDLEKLDSRVLALSLKTLVTQQDLELTGCVVPSRCGWLVGAVARNALSCTDALWWIAHREESALSWMPQAYPRCMEFWRSNPPRWKRPPTSSDGRST